MDISMQKIQEEIAGFLLKMIKESCILIEQDTQLATINQRRYS